MADDQAGAPTAASTKAQAAADMAAASAKTSNRNRLFGMLGLGLLAVAMLYGLYYVLVASHFVSTDDAYVGADTASVTPLTSGPVKTVRVADTQPLTESLTLEQERAVVADKKLLLMAICALTQWTLEQVVAAYRITEAEAIRALVQLDRIGIIELRLGNRYRLKLSKTFRWQPHGPVMDFFRENALLDYFRGGFDGFGEGMLLVHGSVARSHAPGFFERMQRLAQDFARQQQADQKVAAEERSGYTLLLAVRGWEFEAFAQLRRPGGETRIHNS